MLFPEIVQASRDLLNVAAKQNYGVQEDVIVKEKVFLAQHFANVMANAIINIRVIVNYCILWCKHDF